MSRPYQICQFCVMDTSDPDIEFDAEGICNRCRNHQALQRAEQCTQEQREQQLRKVVARIKRAGRNKPYDCVLGVSGGVDSSYAAYLAKEVGLRPLAVHFDNGWNSSQSVTNIHRLLQKLDIELHTYVVDWEEFRELQLSFLKASTPDCEIPSDHSIWAVNHQTALKFRTRYIISGSNLATEGIGSGAWSRGYNDWKYISSVHKQFSRVPLRSTPHYSLAKHVFYWTYQQRVPILNYVPYSKADAMQLLQDKFGWEYYGGKHYESIYTRFYQGYILPKKFGFDKRRGHLSNLIVAGEVSREAALRELETDPYPPNLLEQDRAFVIKKLGISEQEFAEILAAKPQSFWDYPSYEKGWAYRGLRAVYRLPRTLRIRRLTPADSTTPSTAAPALGEGRGSLSEAA